MVRSSLLLLFLAQTVWPQGTGTIAGRITDALTHQPIHRALVMAPNGSRDLTDDDGSYTVKEVPPGDIPLRIGVEGYRLIEATEPVHVEPGGILKRDFELHPMARLSGKIVDRDTGEPLARRVLIRQKSTLPGGRGPGGGGLAVANQNGEFEIAGLDPGDYTAAIDSLNDVVLVPDPAETPAKTRKAYGAVWYPGVPTADMSTAIHLGEGERRHIEIRLTALESHSAAGLIEAPSGHDGEALSIRLWPNGPATTLPPAGQFRFDGLTRGAFVIEASVGKGASTAYGSIAIDIADSDLDGLKVTLLPAAAVNVKIRMAEDGAPLPSKLQFVLVTASGAPPMRSREHAGDPEFRLEGLAQDDYWPAFFGLPPGFAVARALFQDVDLANRPLALRTSGE
ncbi:MAG: carboxypeptidase regulatory-like domain-containing protein, partial [Acidobacteriota bacterium]